MSHKEVKMGKILYIQDRMFKLYVFGYFVLGHQTRENTPVINEMCVIV